MTGNQALPPRKDPIRAGRIFVLASELTLNDLRLEPHNADSLRTRASQLLTNALECLLLAREEQKNGHGGWTGTVPHGPQLDNAIELLAQIMVGFRRARGNEEQALASQIAVLLANLSHVQSN